MTALAENLNAVDCYGECESHRIKTALRLFDTDFLRYSVRAKLFPNAFLSILHPRQFLLLAPPIQKAVLDENRQDRIKTALYLGKKLSSFPSLLVSIRGSDAHIVLHDGRHRALEMLRRDINAMPVIVAVERPEYARRDAFAQVQNIYGQPHFEGEDYPGWDQESLGDRLKPWSFAETFPVRHPLEKAMFFRD